MSTTLYHQYRIQCITQSKTIKTDYIIESDGPPTKCPEESHVDSTPHVLGEIKIINTISNNKVEILEESEPTGGHFQERTVELICAPNATTIVSFIAPIESTALLMSFITEEIHRGDTISICVGENTPIGVIMANVAPTSITYNPTTKYSINTVIKFTHPDPVYGDRIYTMMVDAPAGTAPINKIGFTNKPFWRHGFPIMVNPTVIEHTAKGFIITLKDVITQISNNLGIVIYIDKPGNKIFVEKNPTNSFNMWLAGNPALTAYQPITLVLNSVLVMDNHRIGGPAKELVGTGKIGGSYVPEDIKVSIHYTNTSPDGEPKKLNGRYERLS